MILLTAIIINLRRGRAHGKSCITYWAKSALIYPNIVDKETLQNITNI
jgi:hypothetical protein